MTDDLCEKADSQLKALTQNKDKLAFEADTLSLARDASVLAGLYREEMQNERSTRLARVMHLKQENGIGTSMVVRHMDTYMKHRHGPRADVLADLDKACSNYVTTLRPMALASCFLRIGVTSMFNSRFLALSLLELRSRRTLASLSGWTS